MTTEWLTLATDDIVQKYSPELKELLKSQKSKMKKLIANNCIQYKGQDNWDILPISGYNSTTYRVNFNGEWSCNCQYNALYGNKCSHIGAVQLWLMRRANKL
jgi:hypothetical protein